MHFDAPPLKTIKTEKRRETGPHSDIDRIWRTQYLVNWDFLKWNGYNYGTITVLWYDIRRKKHRPCSVEKNINNMSKTNHFTYLSYIFTCFMIIQWRANKANASLETFITHKRERVMLEQGKRDWARFILKLWHLKSRI